MMFKETLFGVWARRLLTVAAALIVSLAGLFTMPPIDRDEARYAQASAQMLESGDFVTIKFLDDERNKKPIGIHWLQAASVAAFSSPEARDIWAYRLPSVAGIALAALFTLMIGEALFSPRVGLFGALLLASSPIVAAEATFAKTDAALLASITAAMLALVLMATRAERKQSPSLVLAIALWITIGAGVLLKGPIILIPTAFGILALALRGPSMKVLASVKPILGLLIVAAMVTPWGLAINSATEGRFFTEAVGRDLLGKVGSVQESHWGPPGYHLVLASVLLWPAAPLLAEGVWRGVKAWADWRYAFLLAWLIPGWVLFEATATKLPHYTLPFYPALALLAAHAAIDLMGRASNLQKLGVIAYAGIGFVLAAAFAAGPIAGIADYSILRGIGMSMVFIAGVGWAAIWFWRGRNARAIALAGVMSAAFAWTLLGYVGPRLEPMTLSSQLAAVVKDAGLHEIDNGAPGAILTGYSEPSAVFLLGSGTKLLPAAAAATAAAATKGGAVIVNASQEQAFSGAAIAYQLDLRLVATVDGVNYSNGKTVSLAVYANE